MEDALFGDFEAFLMPLQGKEAETPKRVIGEITDYFFDEHAP